MNLRVSLLVIVWLLAGGCSHMPASATMPLDASPERYVVVTLRNDTASAPPRPGSTVRDYDASANYVLAPATRMASRAVATAHNLREITAWPIPLLGVHCLVFELPPGEERSAVLARLQRDRRVESAQPLQSFRTLGAPYNDPYNSLQRNLDIMGVPAAHQLSTGAGVRVAIIDTGVDVSHPDLAGRIVTQRNFVDADVDSVVAELHGTAVAGLIAAAANNALGIVGIAPAARVQAYRACWQASDVTADARCNTLTLAKALSAAIESKAEIVNLSLSGPADPLLTRIVQIGLTRNVTFVGASPPPQSDPVFPTSIEGVIAVAAAETPHDATLLFAPGAEVLTLTPEGRYDFMSGSSLAAASVSGGIALLLARDRSLRSASSRALLARSTRAIASSSGAATSIDLCTALRDLLQGGDCAAP